MKKRILASCVFLSLILTCVACTTPTGQEAEQNPGKDSEKHSEKDSEISVKWIPTETDYENILLTPFAGYAAVKINASEDRYTYKCGIADAEGNIIVPIIYDNAFPFYDGQYFVQSQNEKKVINAKGEQLFDLSKYDTVDLLTDGFSIVTLNGKKGLITESGKEILPCEYTDVQYNLYLIWAEKDGVWSFFDRNGMLKSDAVYDKIECLRNFHSRGRNYEFNELFKVSKSGKYGVANKEGKEVFPCIYSDLEICDNDVVAVFDGGWKYINITDNSSYYVGGYPEKFSEGLAPLYSDGKYGYINKKWELVIPCKYYDASAFLGGVATVKESPDDFGYLIDKTGKTVVEEKDYDVAVKGEGLTGIIYPNGKAYVRFGPPESIEAVLDERGNPLTEFIYKGVQDFKNGLAVAYKDESGIGLKGLISKSGEEITPFIYENIEFVCDNKYVVIMYDKTNGKEKVGILTVPEGAFSSPNSILINNTDDDSNFLQNTPSTQDDILQAEQNFEELSRGKYVQFGSEDFWVQEGILKCVTPDFLNEELRQLYLYGLNLYPIFNGSPMTIDEYPLKDGSYLPLYKIGTEVISKDGYNYFRVAGRYAKWEDFKNMMLSVYTEEYFPIIASNCIEQDGNLYILDSAMGLSFYADQDKAPDTFELLDASASEITFSRKQYFFQVGNENPVCVMKYTIVMKKIDGKWYIDLFEKDSEDLIG